MEKTISIGKIRFRLVSLVWFALFIAALAFSLWKLPYGFGGSDEGFYPTVAHRLCLGDSLFADEWHLSQLSAFFLYPFVKFFRAVTGTNEGLLMFLRCAYLLMHGAVSAFIYLRLRKYGLAAALASVVYLLYTPFDMMTLSYNTIALDMLALTGALISGSEKGNGAWLCAGLSYALAVVCCPYLAVAYPLFFLAVLIFSMPALSGYSGFDFFNWHNFLRFTLGILIPFALFLIFLFRHMDIDRLIAALPGLMSDPEHPSYSLWFMAKHYVYCILTAHRLMLLPILMYLVHLVLLLADKKRRERAVLHFLFSVFCTLVCLCLFIPRLVEENFNAVIFAPVFMGFTAYVLLEHKPVKLFVSAFVLGIIYSICVSSTSNMGFLVISMAFSPVNAASIIFAGLFLKERRGDKRYPNLLLCVFSISLLFSAMLVYSKAQHCFWDGRPQYMTARIDAGPAKGIVTSEGMAAGYTLIYEDMRSHYGELERDELLVMSQIPWCYLIADDYPYGSFSAWLSGLDTSTVERLELYYSLNPHKLPQYIYIVKDSAFGPLFLKRDDILAGAEDNGYTVIENDISYKLEKNK